MGAEDPARDPTGGNDLTETTSILTPVDFSPQSIATASRAARLSEHLGYGLTLLFVLPEESDRSLSRDDRGMDVRTEREALDELQGLANSLETTTPAQILVRVGEPADVIVSTIREHQPYLVAMATHGRGRFRRLLLGSVANEVLHDTECPLLTEVHRAEVSREFEPYRRVTCALEFTERDRSTLAWASSFAERFGAELTVVHAASGPEQWDVATHLPPEEAQMLTPQEWRERVERDVTNRLEMVLRDSGTTGRVITELGGVEHTVPKTLRSHDVDLLVIGRTHRTGLIRTFGDHTYALIRESPCPVVSV